MTPARLPWPLVLQVLGVIAAVALVVATWPVWLLVFTSFIVASAILPAADWGERRRIPRGVTVFAVMVLVIALVALMGRLLWPALTVETRQFLDQLPTLIENVKGWVGDVQSWFGQWGASFSAPKADVPSMAGAVLAKTFSITAGAVGAVVGLLAIVVLVAYIVIDARAIGALGLALLPAVYRPTARRLAPAVLERVGGYVRGQLVSSVFVGALIAIGLAVLGVKYALLIGTVAAAFNIVPFVGATIALVLAVLSALSDSLSKAVIATVIMWGAQTIEAKLLAPHFVGRATGLHPLAVLIALLAGFHMAGLIGGLVAVPFVAGAWEVVRQLYLAPDVAATTPTDAAP